MINKFYSSSFIISQLIPNKQDLKWKISGYEILIGNYEECNFLNPLFNELFIRIFKIENNEFVFLKQGSEKIVFESKLLIENTSLKISLPAIFIVDDNVFKIEYLIDSYDTSLSNLRSQYFKSNQKFLNFKFKNDLKKLNLPNQGELWIGRDSSNHMVLNHPGISKFHMKLIFNEEIVYIEDLNSKNGVFLNNKRIKKSKWNLKNSLKIGNTEVFVDFIDV